MRLVVLAVLSIFQITVAYALPYGHQSAFLANTTARPGDSAAAVNFPSVLAFEQTAGTKLTSGLALTKPKIYSDEEFQLSTDEKFVPFFAGTIWSDGKFKFSSYARYAEDFSLQASLKEDDLVSRTEVSLQVLELGYGLGLRTSEAVSVGISLALSLQNEQSESTVVGQVSGQDFLSLISSRERIFSTHLKSSVSYQNGRDFFSIGLRAPSLALSEKGESRKNSLLNGSGLEKTDASYSPTDENPWMLMLGWSVDSTVSTITTEAIYSLPVKYQDVTGAEPDEKARVRYADGWQLNLGVEYKLGFKSLLTGFSYKERIKEKNSGEYEDFIKLMTVGYEFKNQKSNPIVGAFYEQIGVTAKIYGLMYTTNYNL